MGAKRPSTRLALRPAGPWRDPDVGAKSRLDPLLQCLLLGWLGYCLASLIWDPGALVLPLANGAGIHRRDLCRKPARTLHHRICATAELGRADRGLRFIVPSYDQVFLAPVAGVLASSIGPGVLSSLGTPLDLSCPISLTLCLFAIWVGGPIASGGN